jgi:hypothetical protein
MVDAERRLGDVELKVVRIWQCVRRQQLAQHVIRADLFVNPRIGQRLCRYRWKCKLVIACFSPGCLDGGA